MEEPEENLSGVVNSVVPSDDENSHTFLSSSPEISCLSDNLIHQPGEKVSGNWRTRDQFFSGSVSSVHGSGLCEMSYYDGDVETFDMSQGIWGFTDSPIASDVPIALPERTRNGQDTLQQYCPIFGNNPFLLFKARGLPWYSI